MDPNTHRLPVRAVVENPHGELRPEMFASFSIATSVATAAPAVPQSALMYDGDVARVFVVDKNNGISGRLVQPGRSHDGYVEIMRGLAAGERVVTAGTLFIDRATGAD